MSFIGQEKGRQEGRNNAGGARGKGEGRFGFETDESDARVVFGMEEAEIDRARGNEEQGNGPQKV